MSEVILDSATFVDLERAVRHPGAEWAVNSIRHALIYRSEVGKPFMSVVSVMEIMHGLLRDPIRSKATEFKQSASYNYQLLELSVEVAHLASEINFQLEELGRSIGLADTIIAATAVQHRLVLVTSNLRHFERVSDVGFPLQMANWRLE